PASTATTIAPVTVATATAIVSVTTATAAASTTIIEIAWWSTSILLDIDQLTGDAGIAQAIQDGRIHLLRQVHQSVSDGNSNAAEVLCRQATLIGDCTNNGTWADILTLTNVQAVSIKVTIVAALMASTTIITVTTATVTSASTTIITLEAVALTTVTLRSRHVLD